MKVGHDSLSTKCQLNIDGKSTVLKAADGRFKLPKSSPGQTLELKF